MIKKRYLFLTLKKKQFEVTLSGEKKIEYRHFSDWIQSRLINKDYDFIKFVNGYGNDKPFMILEYKGFTEIKQRETFSFSNGLIVNVKSGDYAINLGRIVEKGNIYEVDWLTHRNVAVTQCSKNHRVYSPRKEHS